MHTNRIGFCVNATQTSLTQIKLFEKKEKCLEIFIVVIIIHHYTMMMITSIICKTTWYLFHKNNILQAVSIFQFRFIQKCILLLFIRLTCARALGDSFKIRCRNSKRPRVSKMRWKAKLMDGIVFTILYIQYT